MKKLTMVRHHRVVTDHEVSGESPAAEAPDERSVTERDASKYIDKD
jgi:hypothetical protein